MLGRPDPYFSKGAGGARLGKTLGTILILISSATKYFILCSDWKYRSKVIEKLPNKSVVKMQSLNNVMKIIHHFVGLAYQKCLPNAVL